MGMIDYYRHSYLSAISTLKKVILLFPEYMKFRSKAIYYSVLSLLNPGKNRSGGIIFQI